MTTKVTVRRNLLVDHLVRSMQHKVAQQAEARILQELTKRLAEICEDEGAEDYLFDPYHVALSFEIGFVMESSAMRHMVADFNEEMESYGEDDRAEIIEAIKQGRTPTVAAR